MVRHLHADLLRSIRILSSIHPRSPAAIFTSCGCSHSGRSTWTLFAGHFGVAVGGLGKESNTAVISFFTRVTATTAATPPSQVSAGADVGGCTNTTLLSWCYCWILLSRGGWFVVCLVLRLRWGRSYCWQCRYPLLIPHQQQLEQKQQQLQLSLPLLVERALPHSACCVCVVLSFHLPKLLLWFLYHPK